MTNTQKAAFFFISGLLMLMGVIGGVEASQNLVSYDAVYLAAFWVIGSSLCLVGVSYIQVDKE